MGAALPVGVNLHLQVCGGRFRADGLRGPLAGYLNVLSNSRWRERWCRVKDNKLIFHKDRTDLKTHIVSIPLRGCDVIPGLDSKHPLTFRLLRNGQEVAVLEVRCCPRPPSETRQALFLPARSPPPAPGHRASGRVPRVCRGDPLSVMVRVASAPSHCTVQAPRLQTPPRFLSSARIGAVKYMVPHSSLLFQSKVTPFSPNDGLPSKQWYFFRLPFGMFFTDGTGVFRQPYRRRLTGQSHGNPKRTPFAFRSPLLGVHVLRACLLLGNFLFADRKSSRHWFLHYLLTTSDFMFHLLYY